MKLDTTQLVISLLGVITLTALIGTIIIIIYTPHTDIATVTALIAFLSSTTGGLIGYLGSQKNNPPVGNDEKEEAVLTGEDDDGDTTKK